MRVFVTGGTGFVGHSVVKELIRKKHDAVVLSRNSRSIDSLGSLAEVIEPVYGDIYSPDVIKKGMSGCGAVVHLVGIIRETGENTFLKAHYEGAVNVMECAKSLGITRFIHMSAEGVRKDAPSRYHQTKYMAEEYLKASGLSYTIFRPAVMFGPGDKNFNVLAEMIKKAPVLPVIGDGNYKWQPVSVRNVAELFALSIENPKSMNKTYEVKGPDVLTFNQILDLLMTILGVKKTKVHIPAGVLGPVISFFDGKIPLPITTDQFKMLLDEHDLTRSNFEEDLPIEVISLEAGLREYIGKT